MKKLFEYKSFEVVNDPANQDFLRKVREQNPDLYGKFVSIIGNKGLEIALQKYEPYDPDYWKIQNKKLHQKEKRENKEERNKRILKDLEPKIKEIETILKNTPLKTIQKHIENNKNISAYIKSCNVKKKYKNEFLKELKKPNQLSMHLNGRDGDIMIDSLSFTRPIGWYYDSDTKENLILIHQYYNVNTKKFSYSVFFKISRDYDLPAIDNNKDEGFLEQRNNYVAKLGKYHIDGQELYDILFKKFAAILSDEAYEEYLLRRDANKYNL